MSNHSLTIYLVRSSKTSSADSTDVPFPTEIAWPDPGDDVQFQERLAKAKKMYEEKESRWPVGHNNHSPRVNRFGSRLSDARSMCALRGEKRIASRTRVFGGSYSTCFYSTNSRVHPSSLMSISCHPTMFRTGSQLPPTPAYIDLTRNATLAYCYMPQLPERNRQPRPPHQPARYL
jgi:hypothetical protein